MLHPGANALAVEKAVGTVDSLSDMLAYSQLDTLRI